MMFSRAIGPAYELRLSDGETWAFAGRGEAGTFVAELSRVMGLALQPESVGNTIIFQPVSRQETAPAARCPGSWKVVHQDEWQTITVQRSDEAPCLYLVSITEDCLRLPCLPSSIRTIMDVIYTRALSKGGLPIHGGLLEKNGEGVILAATGGTGKTTCCSRIPRPWLARCDDQTLVTCDVSGGYRAHAFPNWNDIIIRRQDRYWNCCASVRLRGIFFLQQASVDGVTAIGGGAASIRLTDLSAQALDVFYFERPPPELIKQLRSTLFMNAAALTRQLPIFQLEASLAGSFWEHIEDALGM